MDPEDFDPSLLPSHILDAIEADSFWCLSRLLDGIQDNYIFAQPGIQRSVKRMSELVARIDGNDPFICATNSANKIATYRQLHYQHILKRKMWNLCSLLSDG